MPILSLDGRVKTTQKASTEYLRNSIESVYVDISFRGTRESAHSNRPYWTKTIFNGDDHVQIVTRG